MEKFLLFRKKSNPNTTRDGEAEDDGLVNSQTSVGLGLGSCSEGGYAEEQPRPIVQASPASSTSGSALPPEDLSQTPGDDLRRPVLGSYPKKKYSSQMRAFNPGWYQQYSWVEYSTIKDSMYCYACRHFGRRGAGVHQETAFTVNGFSTWVKAQKTLQTHNVSTVHRYAMAAWAEFKIRRDAGSRICNALDEGHSKAVRENREYMKAIVEALRYTACQGIALRGHREGEESSNRGNFLEFLHSVSKFNTTVAQKMANCAQNAKYTHHTVQDEVIALMAKMLRDQISSDVRDAGMFALLVDESRDVSKKEQVSVVVRYLRGDGVREDFLHFTPADGLDAESLLALIKNTLTKCNINYKQCIAQCYDGAAVMSGANSGVQERFRREVPQALYVHCHAHRLNLVLTDCVGKIQTAADFFASVQILHNFFSSSIVHNVFLQKQKELEPLKPPLELKSLSETRWACQYTALLAIKKTLPAIHATLQALISQQGARLRTKAKSIMALLDGQFVLQLTLFEDVFRSTKFLSDTLQSPNLDYSSALDLVESVSASLSEKRNETSLADISDKAQALQKPVAFYRGHVP
jgi:hypothetical protein